jgi:putative DNA primase/helicase
MSVQLDNVLGRLKGVKREGAGYKALCPCHSEKTGSLDVRDGDRGVVLGCFGCNAKVGDICAAIGLQVADLFYVARNGAAANGKGAPKSPLTLEAFAQWKGFTVEYLAEQGVAQSGNVLTFKYLKMDGQRAPRQRIRTATGFIWNKAEGKIGAYGLWRIPPARERGVRELYLVEGESDALSLWAHDLTALGIPGASNCETLQAPHVRGFSQIYVVRESDEGGETFETGCIARLANLEFRGAVRVIDMERAAVKDMSDLHVKHLNQAGTFESELALLVEMGRTVELPIVGLEAFDASSIEERKVTWLWPARIPRGKLSLAAGDPGVGKSFFALDIAAHLSTGALWPDGAPNGTIGETIVFSAEDGMADTIVARLIAQKADRTKIKICKRIREMNDSGETTRRGFNLARDLPHLERLLDTYADTQLIIVDPVSAYTGRTDTHKNAELRSEVLDPLAELAERREVAILAITHWNKGSGNSLERVSGSIAFPAAARQVWGFAPDPDDAMRSLMLFGKSNVGRRVDGLAFRISEVDGRATLAWEAGTVDKRLDEVLRQGRGGEAKDEMSKMELACDLIRQACSESVDGTVASNVLKARAEQLGISGITLFRARSKMLKCKAEKRGFGKDGDWWISLS